MERYHIIGGYYIMKRQIKSATGPYGNQINVDVRELENLKQYLQKAYDTLDFIDDETFQAIGDGETMSDDLDIYIRELDQTIKFVRGLN